MKLFQNNFKELNIEQLLQVHGIRETKASQIISAIELSKRFLIKQNKKIITASDVYSELTPYTNKQQEYFIVLYLDGANHLYETRVITIGILNQSLVHPREVYAPAIENRCASIIIAHNHPSGILEASSEDLFITKKLQNSGKLLGIDLLDYIIFSYRIVYQIFILFGLHS